MNTPPLTKEQAVIVSAYTGFLIGNFTDMHAAIEQNLGRPVFSHEMPTIFESDIRPAFKQDFLALAPKASV